MSRWSETTAVFGGAFDPPHLGHVQAVRGLFTFPGVARVLVLPTADPPHKAATTPADDRLALARAAFSPDEGFPGPVEVDDRELLRARRTGAPSYTFDTLAELRPLYRRLAFVLGADQLQALPRWHRFPELLEAADWICLARKPGGDAAARAALRELQASGLARPTTDREWSVGRQGSCRLLLAPTEAPAISSTEIREQIGRVGRIPEDLLQDRVSRHLKSRGLYGTEGTPKERTE